MRVERERERERERISCIEKSVKKQNIETLAHSGLKLKIVYLRSRLLFFVEYFEVII